MATDAKTLVTRDKGPIDFPDLPIAPSFVPDGYLSLGPTIDTTGKSLFGDSWDGKEVYARDLPPLFGINAWDQAQLIDGGLSPSVIPGQSGSSIDGVCQPPTRSQFEIEPASAAEYEAERRAAARYSRAVDWLRQRWWSGELVVYRFDTRMRRVLSKQWANEDWFQWTIRRGISNRFGERGHLFVRVCDLTRALAPMSGPSAGVAPKAGVKPTASADKKEMPPPRLRTKSKTDDAQIRKRIEAVVSEARKRWPTGLKTSLRNAARILADPTQCPQLGANRLTQGPIRDILSGSYPPMISRSIPPPWPKGRRTSGLA
jgi:hypothetical protein